MDYFIIMLFLLGSQHERYNEFAVYMKDPKHESSNRVITTN